MSERLTGLLLLAILVFAAKPAEACSRAEGYRMPSNFELVQRADLIVVARVISGPRDLNAVGTEPGILLETVRVLKGTPPPQPLRVVGALEWNGTPMVSLPTPLGPSHFSTGLGACIRLFYPSGGLLVAMFEQSPDGLHQISDPWARAVEDVESAEGVWVRAIEEYLDILDEASVDNVRQAVETRRLALSQRTTDMAAQAIARDLQHYLSRTATGSVQEPTAAVWRAIDVPEVSGAFIGRPGAVPTGGVRCDPARHSGLIIDLFDARDVIALALVIGGQRFEAENEAAITITDRPMVSGQIAFTSELAQLMQTSAGPAGIESGGLAIAAPPGDILQKLALR